MGNVLIILAKEVFMCRRYFGVLLMPLLNKDYCYLNADGTLKRESSEKQQSKKTKKALIPKFLVFREGLTEVCIWAKALNKSNGI